MTPRRPDIGFIPTPPEVVDAMLSLADLSENDVLYDLGCGDGRIVIAAAQRYNIRAIGIDIDPVRIEEAVKASQRAGVSDRVQFRQQDLFECDFDEATVVILYLLPHLNLKLRPQLYRQLKPGSRIISRDFDMDDWQPDRRIDIQASEDCTLFRWTVQAG
jgi:SAM-dependent methyltransferase